MKNAGPTLAISDETHRTKYRAPKETFRDAMSRIANALKDDVPHYRAFREILIDMRFLPAGRVQSAVGSDRQVTASNCFVSGTIEDTFTNGPGSIMARATEAAETMRQGGGIGYSFSGLRPRGDLIKKLGSYSSGPVSFMGIYDAICKCVSSAGHRRGAQMAVMRIDHPDIFEFIRAKHDQVSLTGFNISVAVTDEFMECLATDRPFPLRFEGNTYREVDPADLWDTLMRSTWDWAEPGVLFIDTINRMNNLWYCETIEATNPCVPGDTFILTDSGHAPIASLLGKPTRVWNGECWSIVTPFSTGYNPTVKVTLSDGTSLRCTPNHEWCLFDGPSREGSPYRKKAFELLPGDKLQKFPMPVVVSGSDPFVDAYSQGFYEGDGSSGLNRSFIYESKYSCLDRLYGDIGEPLPGKKARVWTHGPMLDKGFVPVRTSLNYCLDWLAGLLDSDGCVTSDKNGSGFQISSTRKDFLLDVRLMLTRLGVRAKVCGMHDPQLKVLPGGEYWCHASYRLLINNEDAAALLDMGLKLSRLKHDGCHPQRDARRFVTVVSVEQDEACETFCFTEPLANRGTFNGIVTGQCAEQPLPPHGACLLGSINLVRYLRKDDDGSWSLDKDQLKEDIPVIVRAMDNIIDRSTYPLPEQGREARSKRRMGLGITGVANAIEARGPAYGSAAYIKMQDEALAIIRDYTYWASVQLATEKGAFAKFDRDKYCEGNFIKTLPEDIQADIHKYGIRNSHLTSIAPTGTISLCADNVSSGIEPVFAYSYDRTLIKEHGPETETIDDYGVRVFGVKGKRTSDVTIKEHLDVLLSATKHVDSAVSKTCNVGPEVTWDEFKDLYRLAYEGGAKGCTTFRADGKRMGILVAKDSPETEEVDGEACYYDPATGKKTCE